MHAHYHTTSKLSRKIGPRKAVIKGLTDSLILYERITTTEAKAKALVPYFERLVTRAKKGRLVDVRYINGATNSTIAAIKLNTELVKGFEGRNGGYTRMIKVANRRGDNARMVVVELVLPVDFGKTVAAEEKPTDSAKKPAAKKPTTKKPVAKKAPVAKAASTKAKKA